MEFDETVRNFSFFIVLINTSIQQWSFVEDIRIHQQDDYDAHMLNYGQKVDEVSL